MRPLGLALALAVAVVASVAAGHGQDAARQPAVRVEPITAIIDAYATHPVVALGEGPHGNVQGHEFRLALYRDPRFAAVVNDIVVESGNARYQDDVDRFVRGDDVADVFLRAARENTVTPTPAWDRPIYDELFRAVRDLNRSLPRERQLRILLGDPPINWSEVRNTDDYRAWLRRRDSHPAELIQREVLAKGRRALVVYGDGHFQARSERPGRSLVGILETAGTRVFAVTSTFGALSRFQPDVTAWPMPGFALLRGTLLGAAPYDVFFGPPPPVEFFKANPLIEDHFDAVLMLGTAESMRLAPFEYPHCLEPDYVRMRLMRMKLAGMPDTVSERLRTECAAAASQ